VVALAAETPWPTDLVAVEVAHKVSLGRDSNRQRADTQTKVQPVAGGRIEFWTIGPAEEDMGGGGG